MVWPNCLDLLATLFLFLIFVIEATSKTGLEPEGRSKKHRSSKLQLPKTTPSLTNPSEEDNTSIGPLAKQGALCANKSNILLRVIHVPKAGGIESNAMLASFTALS